MWLFARGFLLAGPALSCAPAPTGPDCPLSADHLLLATTDFEVGALAAVDADGCVHDAVSSAGPDPLVRALPGGLVIVAERAQGDAVRLYDAGRYEAPTAEVVVAPEGNVHDVVRIGDALWFALYERAELVVTELDGRPRATVDLSAWADADGLPEIDRLVLGADGALYVGLQRMIRGGAVWQPDEGVVVAVDPADPAAPPREIARPGPNPKLVPHPADPERLLVLTGVYGEPDGALIELDLATGEAHVVATERDLGFDLSGAAGVGTGLVLSGVDFAVDGPSRLVCVDLATGVVTAGPRTDGWFVDLVAGGGQVWAVERTGFAGEPADGVRSVEPGACTTQAVTDGLTLDPYGAAWVDGGP